MPKNALFLNAATILLPVLVVDGWALRAGIEMITNPRNILCQWHNTILAVNGCMKINLRCIIICAVFKY